MTTLKTDTAPNGTVISHHAHQANAEKIVAAEVTAYKIPTDQPESDGTLKWNATTLIVVNLSTRNHSGLGYAYSSPAVCSLIREHLFPVVLHKAPNQGPMLFQNMVRETRNLGRPGITSMAISAVDVALWDLRAKQIGISISDLHGRARDATRVYGSGGFTSFDDYQLQKQAEHWIGLGINQVKIKVGREPEKDPHRAAVVAKAMKRSDQQTELFVDANGAYSRKQAIGMAQVFADEGATWFEEPVSSDDLDGLRLIRDACVGQIEISAGEYGFHPIYFRRMLEAGAVDVMQADATRCGGITGFLAVAALCDAFQVPLSAHCAPTLHMHLACMASNVRHIEYFHDHVRIEQQLFEGFCPAENGCMTANKERSGLGINLRTVDANQYQVQC